MAMTTILSIKKDEAGNEIIETNEKRFNIYHRKSPWEWECNILGEWAEMIIFVDLEAAYRKFKTQCSTDSL